MSKMRTALVIAATSIVGVGVGIGLSPMLKKAIRVENPDPPWITVHFDSMNFDVKYRQGRWKRAVPLGLRWTERLGPLDAVVLTNIVDPGEYDFTLTTDAPNCSAGNAKFSWGTYRAHWYSDTREIVMSIEPSSRVPKIIGEVPISSARFPDCVRVSAIRDDGVKESHDLNFAQFE